MVHPPASAAVVDPCAPWRSRLGCPDLVGRSPALAGVLEELHRCAPWDLPVLLTGPTGCGKTYLARVLHRARDRRGELVRVDCGLPDQLFARELFGNERGAFTGAERSFEGRVGLADGGTLFLDEVGDLSPLAQATLLTFLDEGRYRPLGARSERRADVRIVAATHRDLSASTFRDDLWFRLGGASAIEVPGLESRREDIVPLAEAFASDLCLRHHRRPPRLSEEVLLAWTTADWPGNVRQLATAVESAVGRALAEGSGAVELPHLQGPPSVGGQLDAQLEAVRRAAVEQALRASGGAITEAAQRLGIGRTTLYDWLRRWRAECPER